MRLSEAMRDGIKNSPRQLFSSFSTVEENGEEMTCAFGAACLGCNGVVPTRGDEESWEDYIQRVERLVAICVDVNLRRQTENPARPEKLHLDSLVDVIYDLNDNKRWSREQIADWLESEGL